MAMVHIICNNIFSFCDTVHCYNTVQFMCPISAEFIFKKLRLKIKNVLNAVEQCIYLCFIKDINFCFHLPFWNNICVIIGRIISPCTTPNHTRTYMRMIGLQVCIANKKLTTHMLDIHGESESGLRSPCHIRNIYIQGLV